MKALVDVVASQSNPNGPPLNARPRIAAVPRLRRRAARLSGSCSAVALISGALVMVSLHVENQKSLWAGIGTWYPTVAPWTVSIRTGLLCDSNEGAWGSSSSASNWLMVMMPSRATVWGAFG